jgi:nucleoid-associated protein YgaU
MAPRRRADPPPPKATASYPQSPEPAKGRPTAPERIRGRVILWAEKASITLVLRNFALPQVLNERTGGWEVIERPDDLPVVHWTGYKAVQIRLTLLVDDLMRQRSVEEDIGYLRDLTLKGQLKTPPSLIVIGQVPYALGTGGGATRWVVANLEIEETDHIQPSGQCCRAKATVDLLAYTTASDSTTVKAAATALTKRRQHRWKSTDTLHDLAEHYLGDAARFNSIRSANPKIKSFSNLKAGTLIYIPAQASVG